MEPREWSFSSLCPRIVHSSKKCSIPLLLSTLSTSLPPLPGEARYTGASVPRRNQPRSWGSDGGAGKDVADLVFQVPLSVCQCFGWWEGLVPMRALYSPWSKCPVLALCCSMLVVAASISHITHRLPLKTVIWSLTIFWTFEYHDHRLIYFLYFKGWCGQDAVVLISTFARAFKCEWPIIVQTWKKRFL